MQAAGGTPSAGTPVSRSPGASGAAEDVREICCHCESRSDAAIFSVRTYPDTDFAMPGDCYPGAGFNRADSMLVKPVDFAERIIWGRIIPDFPPGSFTSTIKEVRMTF